MAVHWVASKGEKWAEMMAAWKAWRRVGKWAESMAEKWVRKTVEQKAAWRDAR